MILINYLEFHITPKEKSMMRSICHYQMIKLKKAFKDHMKENENEL